MKYLRLMGAVGLAALLPMALSGLPNINQSRDFAAACYRDPLPSLAPSPDNRTIPWELPASIMGHRHAAPLWMMFAQALIRLMHKSWNFSRKGERLKIMRGSDVLQTVV